MIVIIADDNPILRDILSRKFSTYNILTLKASIPIAVYTLIKENDTIKGLITDMMFDKEDITGVELTQLIRNYEKDASIDPIAIIGLSGHSKFHEPFMKAGGSYFIDKPISNAQIEYILKNYLS